MSFERRISVETGQTSRVSSLTDISCHVNLYSMLINRFCDVTLANNAMTEQ